MDPHSPYYPTDRALALMGDGPLTPFRARYLNSYWNRSDLRPQRLARYRSRVVALYDAGIRWVDAQMAHLIEALSRAKVWDNCIFAFTADHGEEFLEHGGRYHPPSRLIEELIRVPLLLRVPGRPKKNVAKSPFSLLHLAPTLLDVAQVPVPSVFRGRSHWPQVRDGASDETVAISESVAACLNPFRPENRLGPRVLSVRESRFKLVLYFDPPRDHLYDLEADPKELAPLASALHKPVRRRLLEIAHNHLRHSIEERDSRARISMRLRELQLEWKKRADRAAAVAS
jgi:arylsulfatase A-like enzyme